MPELPEVETTRLGILPHVVSKTIKEVIIRNRKLRQTIATTLRKNLLNQKIYSIERRAKYLLYYTNHGCMIMHLGMSGSLRIVDHKVAPKKHDHLDILLQSGKILRFHDPRRFGLVIWTSRDPLQHKLIKDLGPEPLSRNFDGQWLYQISRKRKQPVKNFIMNSHHVAGIGNIYANEALFLAAIHPKRQAGKISLQKYQLLANAIKTILSRSTKQGGTTLRDFVNSNGKPGYFQQQLNIYGRAGEPCRQCGSLIRVYKLQQRSSFYCTFCQR